MGPSSERSAQSTLPLQILSGVRQTEESLAHGYLGGLHAADSHDSSSERSSQSMSPSHTQLFVMHLPAGAEQTLAQIFQAGERLMTSWWNLLIYTGFRNKAPCWVMHSGGDGFLSSFVITLKQTPCIIPRRPQSTSCLSGLCLNRWKSPHTINIPCAVQRSLIGKSLIAGRKM